MEADFDAFLWQRDDGRKSNDKRDIKQTKVSISPNPCQKCRDPKSISKVLSDNVHASLARLEKGPAYQADSFITLVCFTRGTEDSICSFLAVVIPTTPFFEYIFLTSLTKLSYLFADNCSDS